VYVCVRAYVWFDFLRVYPPVEFARVCVCVFVRAYVWFDCLRVYKSLEFVDVSNRQVQQGEELKDALHV